MIDLDDRAGDRRLLRHPDAARLLGVSIRHLHTLVSEGLIPVVRLSKRCVRYDRADIRALIVKRKGLRAGTMTAEEPPALSRRARIAAHPLAATDGDLAYAEGYDLAAAYPEQVRSGSLVDLPDYRDAVAAYPSHVRDILSGLADGLPPGRIAG